MQPSSCSGRARRRSPAADPETVPLVEGIHDVSAGGLAVCLAELATAQPGIGVQVSGLAGHAELFSEAPSRVVVCTRRPGEVAAAGGEAGIEVTTIGVAGGSRFVVEGLVDLELEELTQARSSKLSSVLDF